MSAGLFKFMQEHDKQLPWWMYGGEDDDATALAPCVLHDHVSRLRVVSKKERSGYSMTGRLRRTDMMGMVEGGWLSSLRRRRLNLQ
jgi:hypothetical protein